ncbi:MAG: exosortase/archaeosortase family protein [Bacteroidales bacterium]|nr:exosortase/archaeosortase family protein [Bacteroidales bacterium]
MFFPVLNGLWSFWSSSDEYSHGFFIIPVVLYICWQKKQVLEQIFIRHSWLGLIGFVFALLLYIGSKYAGIATIAATSMIFCLIGLILFLYGWEMMKELAFPLFFLFFMIPVPGQIYSSLTVPLQLIVSELSVSLASSFGLAILREGNIIHLPDQTLQVVQACSGIRSLMSLLTLSLLMGYFSLRKNIFRFALFVSAVPIAIIVNIVRVFIMIIASYYFQYDLAADSVHTIYGVVIFFLALAMIFVFQKVLQIWDTPINSK